MTRLSITAIIAGFLTVFIHYSIRYAYGMLLPEMLPVLEINKTEAGVIMTSFFIIYTILAPLTGALSDNFSFRIILPMSVFILGAGALLMASAATMIQASLFFGLAAIGAAGCWAPVMVFVQKAVPPAKKGIAVSLVGTGTCLGIFLTGFLLPILVSRFSWKAGWVMLGLTGATIAIINASIIRNPVSDTTGANQKLSGKFNIRQFVTRYHPIFPRPNFWLIAIAYFFVGFNIITMFTFLPLFATENLHVPYHISTRFISVIAAAGIVGQLTLGYLSDKIGRKVIMIICGLFLGLPCLGFALSSSILTLFIMAAFWGIGYGAVCAIYSASASDYFPREYTGGIVGIWTAFLGLGSMIAPIICGGIIDHLESYAWVFGSGALVAAMSILLISITRKPGLESITG